MKPVWNTLNFWLLLFIVGTILCKSLAVPVDGNGRRCRREVENCPTGCSSTLDSNGCTKCQCGDPFYRAPKRYCPKVKCPSDCGFKKNAMGCPTCYCNLNSFYRRSVDILKYRPTERQPLAIAAEAKRMQKLKQLTLNSIAH